MNNQNCNEYAAVVDVACYNSETDTCDHFYMIFTNCKNYQDAVAKAEKAFEDDDIASISVSLGTEENSPVFINKDIYDKLAKDMEYYL